LRVRGALARRAAAADAAFGKRESVGAVDGSALDCDVRGGEAACFVDSVCGLVRGWCGAGSSSG
jgi:hypothetical protein